MALTAAEMQQIGQMFANEMKTIFNSGDFSLGGKVDDKGRRPGSQTKAQKDQSDFYKVIADDIGNLEKTLPKAVAKSFSKSGSEFINTVGDSIKDIASLKEASLKIAHMEEVQKMMVQFKEGTITLGTMNSVIRDLGYSGEELIDMMGNINDTMVEEHGIIKDNADVTAAVNIHIAKLASEAQEAAGKLNSISKASVKNNMASKAIFAAMIPFGKGLIDATKAAAKFGTTVQIVDAYAAGMAPEEFSALQSEHRQSIMALGGSYKDYNSLIHGNSLAMIQFTGDLGEATRATANIITTSRMLGDANIDTAGFLEQQTKTFGRFNRVLGTTWEQFSELNNTLSMSSEIRNNLVRMDKTRRIQAFQEIQQNYERYRTQGLLHEQAVALTKTMETMAGMTAKSRIQKGARISAIAGSVGMGAEGERIREIMGKGTRATGAEKAEMAGLLTDLNKVIGIQIGSSNAQALALEGLIGAGDVGDLIGPGSQFTDAALAEASAAKEGAVALLQQQKMFGDHVGVVENNWTKGLMIWDTILTFIRGPFFAAVLALGAGKLLGMARGGAGAGVGAAGKGFLGGGVGKLGAAAGVLGAAGSAAAVGYAVGTYINDQILPETWKEGIGEAVGGFASLFQKPKEEEQTAKEQLAELRRANGISEDFLAEQKKTNREINKTKKAIEDGTNQAAEDAQENKKALNTTLFPAANYNPVIP